MDLGTFQKNSIEKLTLVYNRDEAIALFKVLAADILGYQPYELVINRSEVLQDRKLALMGDIVRRLLAHEPIQYALGRAWFNGMHLRVNRHTLIPRQETEELVAWISNDMDKPEGRMLDIGTGSGCIAISLANAFPEARVAAVDFSAAALEMARMNAEEQKVAVQFIEQDILALDSLSQFSDPEKEVHYDLIVSNPPYVRDLEKEGMAPNVLDFEPESALFVSDHDPLVFYRKISHLAYDNLLDGGCLYFEINQYLGQETTILLKGIGFTEVELRKDLLGNDRMIKAVK